MSNPPPDGALFDADDALDLAAIALGGDGALARRFGSVPFTVFNVATDAWQRRKRHWIDKGIRSEEGRDAGAYAGGLHDWAKKNGAGAPEAGDGVSIFDPVLCEMLYRWLCPPGGMILDPFAGGSVRGIVAGAGGYRYHGIELRSEQVEANYAQRDEILDWTAPVEWVAGDSTHHLPYSPAADLMFTCPPYYDLEVYSDDPLDLSALPTYSDFLNAYSLILGRAVDRLADDRFAVVVVGDFRDKRTGYMRPFVADTIYAMEEAGAHYYQELIIQTPAGTLPVRTAIPFARSRKFGKQHQQALVFIKGDPVAATAAIDPNPRVEVEGEAAVEGEG
jgi:DNA modification methylase